MRGVRFPNFSDETRLAVDGKRKALEGWLFDAKHATYGLSLLRILYGLLMMGLLTVNFADRQYIWGVGSRWLQPLVAEDGFTPPFTLFSGNSPRLFNCDLSAHGNHGAVVHARMADPSRHPGAARPVGQPHAAESDRLGCWQTSSSGSYSSTSASLTCRRTGR